MCVSSVAWLYNDLETVRRMARLATEVTHNHPEGTKTAEAVASAIYLTCTGSIAEGYYGAPEELKAKCRDYLPELLLQVLMRFENLQLKKCDNEN